MPRPSVLNSRRFWTTVSTVVFDSITILISIYILDPKWLQLATTLVTGVTSIAGIYIGAITVDNINQDRIQQNITLQKMSLDADKEYQAQVK